MREVYLVQAGGSLRERERVPLILRQGIEMKILQNPARLEVSAILGWDGDTPFSQKPYEAVGKGGTHNPRYCTIPHKTIS